MKVLSLASNLAQWSFALFQLKMTLQPKKQFPIEVNCDSFYDEVLIYGGFFAKQFNVESTGWAGSCGRGQQEKQYCIFCGLHNHEVDPEARKLFWRMHLESNSHRSSA